MVIYFSKDRTYIESINGRDSTYVLSLLKYITIFCLTRIDAHIIIIRPQLSTRYLKIGKAFVNHLHEPKSILFQAKFPEEHLHLGG